MPDAKNELGLHRPKCKGPGRCAHPPLQPPSLGQSLGHCRQNIQTHDTALLTTRTGRALGWTPASHPPAWSLPTTQRAAGVERIPSSAFRRWPWYTLKATLHACVNGPLSLTADLFTWGARTASVPSWRGPSKHTLFSWSELSVTEQQISPWAGWDGSRNAAFYPRSAKKRNHPWTFVTAPPTGVHSGTNCS